MATVTANKYKDLIDLRQEGAFDSGETSVIQLFSQNNSVLEDAVLQKCNKGGSHVVAVQRSLPGASWIGYNQGVEATSSQTSSFTVGTGMIQSASQVDVNLLKGVNNPAEVRSNEAMAHIESLGQNVASSFFYGNANVNGNQITGVAPMFNSLTNGINSTQVIDGGGTTNDNTSVWVLTWGNNKTSLVYPENSKNTMGISREDMGKVQAFDSNSNTFWVMEDRFMWHGGVAVADYRYVVRIANIDISKLKDGTTNIYKLLVEAGYIHHTMAMGNDMNTAIYCNRDIMQALDSQATNKGSESLQVTPSEIQGKMITTYRGVKVSRTDALLSTESRVV